MGQIRAPTACSLTCSGASGVPQKVDPLRTGGSLRDCDLGSRAREACHITARPRKAREAAADGITAIEKTIGIVEVACLVARIGSVSPPVKRLTRSAARAATDCRFVGYRIKADKALRLMPVTTGAADASKVRHQPGAQISPQLLATACSQISRRFAKHSSR
jgi:hypothetical protein